jgi:putative thiamine transport system permease protein
LATSVRVTLQTGFAATFISLVLAVGFCAFMRHRRGWQQLGGALGPLLAAPHSALAIGLAFLIAPSGWLVRAAWPWLGGGPTPPDVTTVGDGQGAALVVALVLKETPFLILMIHGALQQVAEPQAMVLSRSLGYSHVEGWLKTILPQLYPQIRLPVYAVLAFSLSVVDVALIVGPTNPPTLSVLALRGFTDADVARWFPAAAAACVLFGLVAVAIVLWRSMERAVAVLGIRWIERGRRGFATTWLAAMLAGAVFVAFAASALSIADLALWSFAGEWRFPAAWPRSWTFATWSTHLPAVGASTLATLVVGCASMLLALLLVVGCLENEDRQRARLQRPLQWLIYLPLLIPQIAFLFGVQVLFVRARIDGTWVAVIAMHVIFVLPYLFLALADPWRALDPRYARSAVALGASPRRVFARVKLPLLLRPILIAAAVAFAVSVGQYLPTLFAGGGRIATLTTDAVTLASGADRRIVGVYAALQAALPLIAFLLAAGVPAWRSAQRRARAGRARTHANGRYAGAEA